jgi:hypothetical protein
MFLTIRTVWQVRIDESGSLSEVACEVEITECVLHCQMLGLIYFVLHTYFGA